MTWRIPPIGWCMVCLLVKGKEQAALTAFRGTPLCRDHVELAFANDLEMAVMQAREEDGEDKDDVKMPPPKTGDRAICQHCGEGIVFGAHTVGEWSHARHGDRWCHDAQNYTSTPLQQATPDSSGWMGD